MKKTLLFMNAILFGTLTAFAQNEGQIIVKSGFTADIVAEAVPVEDNLVLGIDNGSVGLYSKTISFENNGLPADMPLKAFETGNLYNIDYTKNNALRLLGPDDPSDTSYGSNGELILANPVTDRQNFMLRYAILTVISLTATLPLKTGGTKVTIPTTTWVRTRLYGDTTASI